MNWQILFDSRACGFADEDDDTYIITGGLFKPKKVSQYNKDGWREDLPSLNTGRMSHGCGTYLNTDNNRVSSSSESE